MIRSYLNLSDFMVSAIHNLNLDDFSVKLFSPIREPSEISRFEPTRLIFACPRPTVWSHKLSANKNSTRCRCFIILRFFQIVSKYACISLPVVVACYCYLLFLLLLVLLSLSFVL